MTPDQRFLILSFAEEAVIYDRLSGDTHYLSELAYARLRGLPKEEIAERLHLADEQYPDALMAVDEQFRRWGLLD